LYFLPICEWKNMDSFKKITPYAPVILAIQIYAAFICMLHACNRGTFPMAIAEYATPPARSCTVHSQTEPSEHPCADAAFPQEWEKPTDVHAEIRKWMSRELPCVAGRREFSRGRYIIRTATRQNVSLVFDDFKRALTAGEAVACLYVFDDPRFQAGNCDAATAFAYLAEQMEPIGTVPAAKLATGGALTNTIQLHCPVTGVMTAFDDFECVAFCPQSADKHDALYDPLMSAPVPVVNMSSDVYGFSRFVADSALVALGKPAHEEADLSRVKALLALCLERWQRFATTTVGAYQAITDTSRCPVHVNAANTHWVAFHKDPAFAETVKEPHLHELPVIYANRLIKRWMDHFHGACRYEASGLARDGIPLAGDTAHCLASKQEGHKISDCTSMLTTTFKCG
jgi:hypothetical protein